MVPDVNGLAKLDPDRLKATWRAEVDRIAGHFGFNEKQRTDSEAALNDSLKAADDWFRNPENRDKRVKYYHDLGVVQRIEWSPKSLANEREWAAAQRKTLDSDRKAVTADLDARAASLREAVIKLASPEQVASAGPYKPPMTTLDYNNALTVYGLIAMGFCLLTGLFSRTAALAGAVFLGTIYLANPPWPWLTANPASEGHFKYVDKNLVELIACLVIASVPTGHWAGLDALFFGARRRRRLLRREQEARPEPSRGAGRKAHPVS
jgi:uncharacterized membrane protein YphA (DoxX/SURF4 family)